MTNTPIQIAERAPSRPIQGELSREANLSPKFEAHGARQGRGYSDHLLIWSRLTLAGKSRRDLCAEGVTQFPF